MQYKKNKKRKFLNLNPRSHPAAASLLIFTPTHATSLRAVAPVAPDPWPAAAPPVMSPRGRVPPIRQAAGHRPSPALHHRPQPLRPRLLQGAAPVRRAAGRHLPPTPDPPVRGLGRRRPGAEAAWRCRRSRPPAGRRREQLREEVASSILILSTLWCSKSQAFGWIYDC